MSNRVRAALLVSAGLSLFVSFARAEASATSSAPRGLDPRRISSGLYAALAAEGAFGPPLSPPRARAGNIDLSKGKPPAVLDARVGANVRIGEDPAALPATQRGQAEPHLVRSSANPDLLLATFQDGRFAQGGGAISCGYAISRDDGFTWTRALIPQLTTASGGAYLRATDPVAAIGPQGDLYLNTLGSLDNAFGLSAVVVSRSTDAGATWSAPVVVFQSPSVQTMPDKNWLGVNDFSGTPNPGRLIVSWTNFTFATNGASTGNNIVSAVSDDRGATWTAPIAVTPAGSSNQGSLPLFLPDGTLVMIYAAFLGNSPQFTIHCKRSLDGGRTYPASATTVVPLVNEWNDPVLRHGAFLPAAAVARTTGEIFVTYVGLVAPAVPRVFVTRSSDRGDTWSAPVAVSDQPPGVSVLNPAIAASADGRTVSVVFADKRLASDGANFIDYHAALSFDGGATWEPNIRLSEMSSDVRYAAQTPSGYMLGDYLAVVPPLTSNQPAAAIWCDTRTGDPDPFMVRFTPSADVGYRSWAVARNLPAEPPFQLLVDTDRDGALDQVEYLLGTNPRGADYGEALVIRRSSPTTLDIAWPQRATLSNPPGVDLGLSANPQLQFGAQALAVRADPERNAIPLPELTAEQLPATPLPPGLVWRGVRDTIASGDVRAATFVVRFTNTFGGNSAGAPVTTVNTDSRLIDVSTRGRSGTGASQMIVGFVVEGGNKSVLLRAIGPTLAQFGSTGVLADPRLELIFGSLGQLQVFSITNDDWANSPGVNGALFARVGAFALPAASKDAAILQTLPARAYTAVVSAPNPSAGSGQAAAGVALVEAYDADPIPGAASGSRFLNLSTRGEVGTGENTLVAGFVVSGSQPRRVLIRAVGPTLAQLGVAGALADPVLTLFRGQTQLAANDDWEISRSGAAIAATAQQVGAFPLNAASLDAALLITLAPGSYTVVISSADGSTGIALVEIYDAD